jgi:hypothetical protein
MMRLAWRSGMDGLAKPIDQAGIGGLDLIAQLAGA